MLKRPELRDGFQGKVFKGNVMGKTCMGACLFSDWLMVRQQGHRLNGHEFEQALGVGDGQGNLVCCSPWTCKELDMTE